MSQAPYTARICGRDLQVLRWDAAGNLLLTNGERYEFVPMDQGKLVKQNFYCRHLLEVAALKSTAEGWLIDGERLPDKPSGQKFSSRAFGLHVLGSELGDGSDRIPAAVAWFRKEDINEGWDEPMLLWSFRCVEAGSGANPAPMAPPPDGGKRTCSSFEKVKLRNGKRIDVPAGSREILDALKELGGRDVPGATLREVIARNRGVKELHDSYSPVKVLKGSTAGLAILSEGIITFRVNRHLKHTLYTLRADLRAQ